MNKPNTQAVQKADDKALTEFVPFGASDSIKLSVAMVRSLIASPTKSGRLPSDGDCIKFIALCRARKLNPYEGDAFLIGYDTKDGAKFNLITAHQAFLKRAELSPEYNGMRSGIIVEREGKLVDLEGDFFLESDTVMGGWATVYFKNREHPMHKRIRLQRFNKGFGVWSEDPAGMICKCSEADALRSSFPTMLGGMYLREEVEQQAQPAKMATPVFSTPKPEVSVDEAKPEPKSDTECDGRDKVRKLCSDSGISESDLVEFLESIALADEGDTIDTLGEATIETVITQWGEFSEKIKEVCE